MYYPYFRGKQFELLTIRRNAQYMSEHSIIPIIEPVRDGKENEGNRGELIGLIRCLTETIENKLKTIVIINPQVGELTSDEEYSMRKILDAITSIESEADSNSNSIDKISIGITVNSTTDLNNCYRLLLGLSQKYSVAFIHETATDKKDELKNIADWATSIIHVATDKNYVRQYGFFDNPEIVKLADPFGGFKKTKNTDYRNHVDSIFTTENVFYAEDGYVGYSDYLTIGKDYSEGGGMPNAVVIHLTYRVASDDYIHIQHFVSEGNNSTNVDVAGKAQEAIEKLNSFVHDNNLPMNEALRKFENLGGLSKFPGLGALKELSMTNHIFVAGEQFKDENM